IEGTEILKCNHIIEFGIKEQSENKVVFIALCLQTSNLNGNPHEIIISKTNLDFNTTINGSCSCKAGTGKCKHVVGFLLKLQKTSEEDIQHLSCTDLRQQWGKMKNTGIHLYKPIPIREFCHVKCPTASYKQSLPNSLPPDLQEEVFQTLLQGFPDSAISIHLKGRHSPRTRSLDTTTSTSSFDKNNFYTKLVTAHSSVIKDEAQNILELTNNCSSDAIHFYKTKVEINKQESINLCSSTLTQMGPIWLTSRKLRITDFQFLW
ncbi:uncharacterized protein LOC111029753, partial [Myzus persicae]|uniref:uncharacterized protein LOC111029753 n=1 Tax=Myzus persicae TaxID=13164 RepID=UPI000B937EA8